MIFKRRKNPDKMKPKRRKKPDEMKPKRKKKPAWQVLYGESQMRVLREICKHPEGILGTELRKKIEATYNPEIKKTPTNSYRLLRRLEEKKLITKEQREKPPYLMLVKPTSEGIKLYKQYLS